MAVAIFSIVAAIWRTLQAPSGAMTSIAMSFVGLPGLVIVIATRVALRLQC